MDTVQDVNDDVFVFRLFVIARSRQDNCLFIYFSPLILLLSVLSRFNCL